MTPEPVEELTLPIAAVLIKGEPQTRSGADALETAPFPNMQDEILQQPLDLNQAARTVVVPVQNNPTPWSSVSLFAGLIGLGVFALIVGLIVARRGVPGMMAT